MNSLASSTLPAGDNDAIKRELATRISARTSFEGMGYGTPGIDIFELYLTFEVKV
jgi:hypothetical protein